MTIATTDESLVSSSAGHVVSDYHEKPLRSAHVCVSGWYCKTLLADPATNSSIAFMSTFKCTHKAVIQTHKSMYIHPTYIHYIMMACA